MTTVDTLFAVADFCLIPMGTGSSSVGEHIAECARILEGFEAQGLVFKMHGYGTNLEGPWPLVSEAIHACHAAVHAQGVPRIATDIRIGTKASSLASTSSVASSADRGKMSENERKLESVMRRLAKSSTGTGSAIGATGTKSTAEQQT
ncbi:hypothetical protein K437DRAFT_263768 [Tilletiaria anomala UBC 951]|uniref:Thiamine-binding protein domain-containing protein n=1 Tax=Tilletiaria anomala (strain ATCC 24038 / CBS 436.72 / UBC 951) TaxID=1037660 RepID=A0A066VM06_TILAU|nr:uncharacterized protein K437DRAFT_263768 [Tilletiaria anomala UBC 951]KDN42516.1 hypothetical protein K437DRAFT_263768 [Tilletiaria anomala UBC 951]